VTNIELTDRSGAAVAQTTAEKPGMFISYARVQACGLSFTAGGTS